MTNEEITLSRALELALAKIEQHPRRNDIKKVTIWLNPAPWGNRPPVWMLWIGYGDGTGERLGKLE